MANLIAARRCLAGALKHDCLQWLIVSRRTLRKRRINLRSLSCGNANDLGNGSLETGRRRVTTSDCSKVVALRTTIAGAARSITRDDAQAKLMDHGQS